jgi:multiple sugar transport system ATP-binding protein
VGASRWASRPEHLEDAAVATGAPGEQRLRGAVQGVEALGSELIAHIEIAGSPVATDEVKEVAADLDATIVRELETEHTAEKLPIVARFDVMSRARVGQPVEVVVDTRRAHFFDLESGETIGGHAVDQPALAVS